MWVDLCTIDGDLNTEPGEDLQHCLTIAHEKGLDGLVVVLDSSGAEHAENLADFERPELRLFVAQSVDCQGVRWIVVPPEPSGLHERAGSPEWELEDLENCVDEGWAVILTQPFEDGPREDVFRIRGIHGVEVATGSENLLQRELALEAALALGVTAIAGARCDREKLGSSGVLFLHPPANQQELVRGIKGNEVYVVRRGAPPEASGVAEESRGRRRPPRKRARRKKAD